MSIQQFLADLKGLSNYSEDLTVEAFFIAGIASARSSDKLPDILEILKQVQDAYESDILSKPNKGIIEYHIYQGKVLEAKHILNSNIKVNEQTEINRTATKDSSLSKKLESLSKPTPIHPPVQVAQKPQPKLTLSPEELKKTELALMETLQVLRRIDEKEALNLRKIEEKKRLEAEQEAKQLKDRLEKEYQEKLRVQLEEQKRLEEQAIRCVYCKEKVPDKEVCMLEKCSHFFHKKCLKDLIQSNLEEKIVPIKCFNCKVELTIIEIKSNLTKRQAQVYEDMLFKAYMHSGMSEYSSCPTPGCSFMFEYEDDIRVLDCPTCKRQYCLPCRAPHHPGMTCGQVFRRAYIGGIAKGQKFKACVMCHTWVEKTNSIRLRCTCGATFCYTCGSYQVCKCGE